MSINNEELSRLDIERELCQNSLIDFAKTVYPWVAIEEVHILICTYFQMLALKVIDRFMLFMAPRTGKTLFGSTIFPAWYFGRFPSNKVMNLTYKEELSTDFGRDVRDLVNDEAFRIIFPGIDLVADNRAAGRWRVVNTSESGQAGRQQLGQYYAGSFRSGVSGRGFNLGLIDDALSEQDADSKVRKDYIEARFKNGFYLRRQPEADGGSAIALITTRWATDDLCGRLIKSGNEDPSADQYTVLNVESMLERDEVIHKLNQLTTHEALSTRLIDKYGKKYQFRKGSSYAPRRHPLKELQRTKKNIPSKVWEALYQGNPKDEEGHILLRKHWRKWPVKTKGIPKFSYVMQVYDTAYSEPEEEDRSFTARTTWGIFDYMVDEDYGVMPCVMLMEAWQAYVGFPELRKIARASYVKHQPDRVLVEKKASGKSLIQELRRGRVPVKSINADKSATSRAHAASVVLDMGCVFHMLPLLDESEENNVDGEFVITQAAEFPFGGFDDLTTTCVHGWNFFRKTFQLYGKEEVDADREDEEYQYQSGKHGNVVAFRGYGR